YVLGVMHWLPLVAMVIASALPFPHSPLLFLDAHPRVLFSASPPEHPPLLLMLESGMFVPLSWVDTLRGAREPPRPAPRRGEMPVCESESVWVTDKTTVIDDKGKTVNIVPEIKTVKGALKQYFYETRCRGAVTGAIGVSGASCRGVDIRQWVSQCKAKDTYVRALTVDNSGLQGWRWVRINSSCVCVLLSRVTRKNRGRE
uniref:Neurotrophin-4 n=1 Tax=Salmo trutta TaxID=8032 RepID=A0A673X6S6_SALTR